MFLTTSIFTSDFEQFPVHDGNDWHRCFSSTLFLDCRYHFFCSCLSALCCLQIESMDALFEAQFSPLADSGRLLSKCGKCGRYMKYISTQPMRMYCVTCEEVHYLPQNGSIKVVTSLKSLSPFLSFVILLLSICPHSEWCQDHIIDRIMQL
jgi:hypothetical protein